MPKRATTAIVLSVLLTLAAIPAMAMGEGNSTQEVPAAKQTVAGTIRARTLAAVHTQQKSGLKAWHYWHHRLRAYQKETRVRQMLMQQPQTRLSRRLASSGLASLIQYTRYWKKVSARVLYKFRHPPYLSAWMCIHHYEGAWDDPGSPYWGGLQMDLSFQKTYGRWLLLHKGTADKWTPMEQIWVAVRAERVRGFNPWPNTAHYCGLR